MSAPAICVFCGSRRGANAAFEQAAGAFGRALGARAMALVYGGGNVGLMGTVADAAMASGARVTGVIPEFLRAREVAHAGIDENLAVDDLFARKQRMIDLADAFVALPGGIGTYDEILEVIAWRQLRQLDCPIGLLDTAGYFAPFRALLDHTIAAGFLRDEEIDHLIVEAEPAPLLDRIAAALAR
ncbi:MAG: LOG family protein [Gammaproteobacteria bacterium]